MNTNFHTVTYFQFPLETPTTGLRARLGAKIKREAPRGKVVIIPDGWTSKARVGYYSTCAQYLDPSFRLQKMAVGFKDTQEKHTGENIANMIKDSFDQMGLTIHRDSVYVSDNASNMVKAAQVLEVFRLPCFAHTLNLSVKAGLKIAEISPLVKKCKELSKHFWTSSADRKALKAEQVI